MPAHLYTWSPKVGKCVPDRKDGIKDGIPPECRKYCSGGDANDHDQQVACSLCSKECDQYADPDGCQEWLKEQDWLDSGRVEVIGAGYSSRFDHEDEPEKSDDSGDSARSRR